jgi:ABC-type multidrug transport system fused ATPase/permease subunit
LVILALSPLIGFSGYFMAKTLNTIVSGQLESYAAAGAIAEETFTLIRTVTSFGLQKERVKLYDKELDIAAEKTTRQGFTMGLGFGAVMFFYFLSYAIAFWVGAILVVNSKNSAYDQHPVQPGAPPFCQVGQVAPSICSPQAKNNITFETIQDVCGCPFCQCGCYYTSGPNVTFASSCITGGDVVLTFFAVLIGSFAIGQAAPR